MSDQWADTEDLCRRAELWATGATIHNVRNTVGGLRATVSILRKLGDEMPEEVRTYYAESIAVWSNQLAAYISHGDYRKANRDFPTPKEPPPVRKFWNDKRGV